MPDDKKLSTVTVRDLKQYLDTYHNDTDPVYRTEDAIPQGHAGVCIMDVAMDTIEKGKAKA